MAIAIYIGAFALLIVAFVGAAREFESSLDYPENTIDRED